MYMKEIHYVDRYVGERLRKRRLLLRISQEQLAKCVNLTFQQIQKYEKGLNRVSCSKLYEFACYLKTDISYFFQGIMDCISSGNMESVAGALSDSGSAKYVSGPVIEDVDVSKLSADIDNLLTSFSKIKNIEVRDHILKLVQSLSQKQS
jgi:transcriptional regulator with XRE-family HTH domain